MIADAVSRYPINLWNWGINNRSGHLREINREVARMNLLPRKEISLTPQGLHFERALYYSCESLVSSGLMMRKRGRSYPKVIVAYDPRSTDHIYIPSADGTNFDICPLTPAAKSYMGLSLYDAQYYFNEETQNNELSQSQQIQSRAQFNAISDHITSRAIERTMEIEEQEGPISDSQRLKGIRENRAQEREKERHKNKWPFVQEEDDATSVSQNIGDENSIEDKKRFIKPVSNANTIRSIRNKKREVNK